MGTKPPFYHKMFITFLAFVASLNPHAILANDCGGPLLQANERGGPVLQVGWFTATQGKSQHVDIEGLIGDDFDVKKSSDQNFLVGIGHYFEWLDIGRTSILYGINAFYLAPVKVEGNITQEDKFTNLSYHYYRTNYPIYLAAKTLVHCNRYNDVVIDLGIGPNIINTKDFKERSLDGGITIPDAHIFTKKTVVAFSATAGFGWRINEVFGSFSFEIDYRFFYLGQGELKKNNKQLRNTLRTGNSYGNSIFFSILM